MGDDNGREETALQLQRLEAALVGDLFDHPGVLTRKAQGWFTGYNSNVEGHEAGKFRHVIYNGGAPKYMARLDEVVGPAQWAAVMRGLRQLPKPHAVGLSISK